MAGWFQTVQEFIRDAKLAGWRTELTNDGWKFFPPREPEDSTKFVHIHMTPSDNRTRKNVEADLKALGFYEDLERGKEQQEKDRLARIEEDRRKNDERLTRIRTQEAALRKAAGVTEVAADVLLAPHPVPKVFEQVLITPDLADKMLARNTSNRRLRKTLVANLVKTIRTGQWAYTHQGVAFDTNGVLQDGQHRLAAVVEAGTPVLMQVSVGMPPTNYTVVDIGARRNFGDVVGRHGLTNASRIGSFSRLVLIYDEYPRLQFREAISNTQVERFVLADQDRVMRAANLSQTMWTSFHINASGCAAGLYVLWREMGEDHPKVQDFLEGLKAGNLSNLKDSRLALRRYCINPKNPRYGDVHFALFIKCWNAYLAGRDVEYLGLRKNEEFPKLRTEDE